MIKRVSMTSAGWIVAIAAALAVLWATTAGAAPITYRMVHQVTESTVSGVAVGDRLVSRFVLDSGALDLDASPNLGVFEATGSPDAPAWTTVNQSDPGVTLLELLAYAIEVFAALQDQVADEALLESRDDSGEPLFTMRLLFAPLTFADDRWPENPPSARRVLSESDFTIFVGGDRIVAGPPLEIARVAAPGAAAMLTLAIPLVLAGRRAVQGSASVPA